MEVDRCVYDQLQKEQEEYEYYTVTFTKSDNIYSTNPDHPLLLEVKSELGMLEGQAIFTQQSYELLRDKLEMHQANIIIK